MLCHKIVFSVFVFFLLFFVTLILKNLWRQLLPLIFNFFTHHKTIKTKWSVQRWSYLCTYTHAYRRNANKLWTHMQPYLQQHRKLPLGWRPTLQRRHSSLMLWYACGTSVNCFLLTKNFTQKKNKKYAKNL